MNIFQEAKQVLDKDGKVNPLGPYGKSKLTGSEVASYFRKHPVRDPQVKKAVEVALDLEGAFDVAMKAIKNFYGDKILKSKEVQTALRFANEEVEVIGENYRTLAQKGMGTESEKDARVGLELDFYDSQGNKQFGKIVKKDRKGYTVKDEKGKTHTFMFLDRQKAKKLLTKEDTQLGEAMKIKDIFRKHKREITKAYKTGDLSFSSSAGKKAEDDLMQWAMNNGEVKSDDPDDFFDWLSRDLEDIVKGKIREAVSPAQQAAIAIAKKEKEEKNESVFNSYRRMVEMWLDEEVANITVDPKNRIPTPAGQNKHSLEIVKQARRFGIKASQLGKHIRIKGNKKAVNDFLRMVIGRSSYGDPTEKDTSTPQIDKMLTKGLK